MSKKPKVSKKEKFVVKDAPLISVKYKVCTVKPLTKYTDKELYELADLIDSIQEYRKDKKEGKLIDLATFKEMFKDVLQD